MKFTGDKGRKHTIHPLINNPLLNGTYGRMSFDFNHGSHLLVILTASHIHVVGLVQVCAGYILSWLLSCLFSAAFAALLVFARTAISYSISISQG